VVAQQKREGRQAAGGDCGGADVSGDHRAPRVLDLNTRARDNARAHFEFANQRFQGGIGSRLNMLRAEQETLSNETRVEEALLAIQQSQEALGVLVGADGRWMRSIIRTSTFPTSSDNSQTVPTFSW
jgi:outer membrane protein TolC